jgi:hypothetical protein
MFMPLLYQSAVIPLSPEHKKYSEGLFLLGFVVFDANGR